MNALALWRRVGFLAISLAIVGSSVSVAGLSFEDRVEAQAAIDRVRYSHQIGVTRPFEDAVTSEQVRLRVQSYLDKTAALEHFWDTRITVEMLDREVERMARHSRLPARLNEIFVVLGHDPVLIRECLARPALVDRLTRSFFVRDERIHAGSQRRIDALAVELAAGRLTSLAEHPLRTVKTLLRDGTAASELGPDRVVVPDDELTSIRARAAARRPEVEENDAAFVVQLLLDETPDSIKLARYEVAKKTWDEWWTEVRDEIDEPWIDVNPGRGLPLDIEGGPPCAPDHTWLPGSLNVPQPRVDHTAVWTGDRMIIWGGFNNGTGYLYDPATDTWMPMSALEAPVERSYHTAVWTGDEMIVWGGFDSGLSVNTGGRYNPYTDTWTPTSTSNAPEERQEHSAVWTGTRMIVWGGRYDSDAGCVSSDEFECIGSDCCVAHGTPGCTDPDCEMLICESDAYCCDVEWDSICAEAALADPTCEANCAHQEWYEDGGAYDPTTDSWVAVTWIGAPNPRTGQSTVWTGSEMLVWGGRGGAEQLDTGGAYDPELDSWRSTSTLNAPAPRRDHAAVWTASEMIVWGGSDLDSGGRYDPVSDSWSPTSTLGCPEARSGPTGVWTGSELLVWGGSGLGTGGRYDPVNDVWAPIPTLNAPDGRSYHTAIWTGSQMIVWGGASGPEWGLDTGGRYDPIADAWTPTSFGTGPSPRCDHAAVWTGTEMIVWGGQGGEGTGGRYDPTTDTWTDMATSEAPEDGSAVWTGHRMLVWHGEGTGGRYDPWSDTWSPISSASGPQPRTDYSVVWTGTEMVVWGGWWGSQRLDTGNAYDPELDRWRLTSTLGAPDARSAHSAVWTGNEMIVWGGRSGGTSVTVFDTGGRYDPVSDSWQPTSTVGAPTKRQAHTAVWTGDRMIVWGGANKTMTGWYNTGGIYDPEEDTWAPTATYFAPPEREDHTAVWTGSEMIVWGGMSWVTRVPDGGVYDPSVDSWTPTSLVHAPERRRHHTAIRIGGLMIVWGGWTYGSFEMDNGGIYAYGLWVDDDGDGLSECEGDCDDSRPECFSDCMDQDADAFCGDADCDDTRHECFLDCTDADADAFCADADCSPRDGDTYPDAAEVNDGLDNQCPGNAGYGLTDEITGVSGFFNPTDEDEYSWPTQPGASSYHVARGESPDFAVGCTLLPPEPTTSPFVSDPAQPLPGDVYFYLAHSVTPHSGSWGRGSEAGERSVPCDQLGD